MIRKELVKLTQEPGIKQAREVFGDEIAEFLAEFWSDLDEEFAKNICNYSYGSMYSRNVLTQKQRELCAVSALTALGESDALAVHITATLKQGATPVEIAEAIIQTHLYAGIPKTMKALKILRERI